MQIMKHTSKGIHLCQVRIRLPTLALKTRGDVTRSPKQGPTKRTDVLQIIFFKKKFVIATMLQQRNCPDRYKQNVKMLHKC